MERERIRVRRFYVPQPGFVEPLTVTFRPGFTEQQQEILVRVLANQGDAEISSEMGIKQDRVQEVLSGLKKLVVKKGEIWPTNRTWLVFSLEMLGEMHIERLIV